MAATVLRILALLFLLLIKECKLEKPKCPAYEPFPVPHEWDQPGDSVIGGVTSHIISLMNGNSFKDEPSLGVGYNLPM